MSTQLPASWSGSTRFLLCDQRSLELLRALEQGGFRETLALVPQAQLAALRAEAGELAPKIHAWRGLEQTMATSADVLWLCNAARAALWGKRSLRATAQIVTQPSPLARAALLARCGAGLLRARPAFSCANQRWLLHERKAPGKQGPRRYLSPQIGIAGLFAQLEQRRLRWVVLRWWQDLPEQPQGDVDLLVHEDDVPAFLEIMGNKVGTIPLDVYSTHGAFGMSYRGATYYPTELALRLLEGSRCNARGVRTPQPEDALYALAFHALYHKGEAAGLSSSTPGVRPSAHPKHDFAALLPSMGRELGLQVPAHMEQLDEFLAERGWRPPRDMLRKWAKGNRWIHARWFDAPAQREAPGWCVFVARRAVVQAGLEQTLVAEIVRHGFQVLARERLDEQAAERFGRHARGGNWGKGDFAADGGPPALLLITYDPAPLRTRRRYAKRYPDMDNGRIVTKRAIRDALNGRLPPAQQANFLHTSDNSDEAWEYVRLALPLRAEALRAELGAAAARL